MSVSVYKGNCMCLPIQRGDLESMMATQCMTFMHSLYCDTYMQRYGIDAFFVVFLMYACLPLYVHVSVCVYIKVTVSVPRSSLDILRQ